MSTRIVAPWCVLQKISCRNFLWTCGGLRVAGGLGKLVAGGLGEVGGGWWVVWGRVYIDYWS